MKYKKTCQWNGDIAKNYEQTWTVSKTCPATTIDGVAISQWIRWQVRDLVVSKRPIEWWELNVIQTFRCDESSPNWYKRWNSIQEAICTSWYTRSWTSCVINKSTTNTNSKYAKIQSSHSSVKLWSDTNVNMVVEISWYSNCVFSYNYDKSSWTDTLSLSSWEIKKLNYNFNINLDSSFELKCADKQGDALRLVDSIKIINNSGYSNDKISIVQFHTDHINTSPKIVCTNSGLDYLAHKQLPWQEYKWKKYKYTYKVFCNRK